MDTPTRRDLFRYALGATLAPALPISAESPKASADKPLVLDLIGPMAFTMGTDVVEVWLPKYGHSHEAAVVTSAGILALEAGDNNISFRNPAPTSPLTPKIYPTNGCKVHSEQADRANLAESVAKNVHTHLTLPMPNNIVAVSGVLAWIYTPATPNPPPNCTSNKPCCASYALGLRFLYKKAGTPTLTHGSAAQIIPLDVARFEKQVIMSISYAPVEQPDDGWDHNARKTFNELASFFGLSREIEIASKQCACNSCASSETDNSKVNKGYESKGSPHHPCRAPIILVTLTR